MIINETFRDENQSKQDETINNIKTKIIELIESNEFKANLSLDRDSFGILALNESSTSKYGIKQLV
jgi:hypothetical protein